MCEYNRPYFMPFGRHPDDYLATEGTSLVLAPPEEWRRRLGEFASAQVSDLEQAQLDAASIACDVHVYTSPTTHVIGIALEPGTGPTVKIWEH